MNNRFHRLALIFTVCLLPCVQIAWSDEVDNKIAELKSSDPKERAEAAEALGKLADKRAIEPLATALNDADSWVKLVTAHALANFKDRRAVEPLAAALKDPNSETRWVVAFALAKFKDARAVEPLIEAFLASHDQMRASIAFTLAQIGSPAIEPLILVLKNKDAQVRADAVYALAMTKDKRVIEPLKAMLHDSDDIVRDRAASMLDAIKSGKDFMPKPEK